MVAVILHCRRRRDSQCPTFRQHVDSLAADRCAKWEVLVLELREEHADGDWIDDSARQRVLSQRAGLLENANLDVAEASACFIVCLNEPRERDRSSESSRPTTDEENIHRHCFSVGRLRQNKLFQRKRSLVDYRKDFAGAIGH